MKLVLKQVASDIEKNFYDPNMKGVDWKAAVKEAEKKIDKAVMINEMLAAIYELSEQVDDSHTVFILPKSAICPIYGFEAKAFGNHVYVYEVEDKGAASNAGLRVGDELIEVDGILPNRSNWARLLFSRRRLYPMDPLIVKVRRNANTLAIEIHPHIKKRLLVSSRAVEEDEIWDQLLESHLYSKKRGAYKTDIRAQVGYVSIRKFTGEDGRLLRGLAHQVKDAKAIIIDLRDNPGGSIKAMASFLGMFESEEVELGKWCTREKSSAIKIKPTKPRLGGPVIVLVDSSTASASEIAAWYLHKAHHAVVLGDRTAGAVNGVALFAGRVNYTYTLNFATLVGVARIHLSGGDELEKKGMEPDIPCVPSGEELAGNNDSCLEQAYVLAERTLSGQEMDR